MNATDDPNDPRPNPEADIEREVRQARKFTPAEALARMAGPGAMKGGSPVSRVQQAETSIATWLRGHAPDPAGALKVLLPRHLKGSGLLLDNLDDPLAAITTYCERVLSSDSLLKELVREADVEWGRTMDERPHFERDGALPHPDDPYTLESVRHVLDAILMHLAEAEGRRLGVRPPD